MSWPEFGESCKVEALRSDEKKSTTVIIYGLYLKNLEINLNRNYGFVTRSQGSLRPGDYFVESMDHVRL